MPSNRRPTARRSGPQNWRMAMLASAIAVITISLAAADAAGAFSGGSGAGPGPGGGNPGGGSPAAAGTSAAPSQGTVCLSNQNCSAGLPYAKPDFLAVAMPRLEADLHKSEAQIVGAMNNGTGPTQLAAQTGLSTAQWYQDESNAFAAGFDSLIAKNELTGPFNLASHPDITTPRQYRDYMVDSIKTQGADFELALALGVNPMQAGIIPGGQGA